jgi:hypothetical protein
MKSGEESSAQNVQPPAVNRRLARSWVAFAAWCLTWDMGATEVGAPAVAGLRPWTEYRVILWVGDSAARDPGRFGLFLRRLPEMGVDTAMVFGGEGDPQPFVAGGIPYYVENIVNQGLCLKWNSTVRDWDKFVTRWVAEGRPESALVREYCLDDPQWIEWAQERMRQAARAHAAHRPLVYDIRDELSTTVSANPFDYDLGPRALAGFRDWLRTQYADLAALNQEWETAFPDWAAVRPFTTDQIKNRMASGEAQPRGRPDWGAVQRIAFDPIEARRQPKRWNFAPWADFRTYMDVALARTLDTLRRAARAIDPQTPVGIEGTQMPHAFGGYDLWRLAGAADWIEPYDIANAREILGSFMPGRPILSTVFESETRVARRRLWHLLLEGDRGCIVWWSEDCIDWKSADYALTAKARALAPVFAELKSPLARLFLRADPVRDPVYIHYSQPSIQVDWLIESTVDGATWHRRFSSFEADHNRLARVRNAWLKAVQDLGFSPQFLSSEQVERWRPEPLEPAVLILPRSLALSDREVEAIRGRAAGPVATSSSRRGARVVSDGPAGCFDAHGRLRLTNAFEGPLGLAASTTVSASGLPGEPPARLDFDTAGFGRDRLRPEPSGTFTEWLASQLPPSPIEVRIARRPAGNRSAAVEGAPGPAGPRHEARARVHRYRLGGALLLACERNIDYHMSEDLKQGGGNDALERPVELDLRLGPELSGGHIYDLRSGRKLAEGRQWLFTLDPWAPSLFAVLPQPVPDGDVVRALEKAGAAVSSP